ncbi:MAG: class A beta-lactamase-related serine hydrolase [Acidobacteriota bacterium]|nr:class A beta-lactamase-related serine hydrolase [Acidobacteriota bacterium]
MQILIGLMFLVAQQSAAAGKPRMNLEPLHNAMKSFDGVAGLAARNLLTGEEIVINADGRFPTASAIKTAVMVEAYHQASRGTLSLDTTIPLRQSDKVGGSGVLNGLSEGLALSVRDLIHLMIVVSDNTATNLLVSRLGTKNVDARMVALGLEHTKLFRPTFRDGKADIFPELEKEFGLGMSTPREMANLMELIATGAAVDKDASAAMLETLRSQQDRAMIPRLLPGNLQVGSKTGTDSEKLADERGRRGAIRVDAGIVTGDGVRYVIALFTRRGGDTRGGADNAGVLLGAQLSRMVYEQFTRK